MMYIKDNKQELVEDVNGLGTSQNVSNEDVMISLIKHMGFLIIWI